MLNLKFDNESLGVASAFEWRRDARHGGDSEVWHVTLESEAATAELLEQALATMREKIGATGDLALLSAGDEVRTLAAADCRVGPTLARVDELDPAPGDAHGRRKLRLHFDATLQDAAHAIQSQTETIALLRQAGAPDRIRTRGKIVLRRGEDPAAHESALPAPPQGFRRTSTTLTRDTAEPALLYELEDEQVFAALPSGVDDGHYVVSESRDEHGRMIRAISGFFVGAGAVAAALALAPASGQRAVRENPFTRRVDFEFREAVPGDSGQLSLIETLAFTTTRRVVDHPLLAPGAPAYRQQIGGAQTEIMQQGSAVGDGRHPAPAPPRYPADLIERQAHYSVPHPDLPADRRWVTSWRYVSRLRAEAFHQPPGTL